MGIELLETSSSPQRACSILSKISTLDGGLNIKSLAGNNPYKSNHFNRTFKVLSGNRFCLSNN